LSDAGISVVAGIDIEEHFRKTYERNNPDSLFIKRDIARITGSEISNLLATFDYGYLMFAGCAPCQPFSSHFKDREQPDDRESALGHFGRIVRVVKPDFVFSENVPGMMRKDNGRVFSEFNSLLSHIGYDVTYGIVNAKWYGIPQDRKRLIVLASRVGMNMPLPERTHGPGLQPLVTVRDAIGKYHRLKAGGVCKHFHNHNCASLSPLNMKRMIATPHDGGGWRDWPTHLRLKCHSKDGSGHTDVYGRMKWDYPAPTLTCRCYSISNGRFGHPSQDRAISFREAAAIQTFSDDYVFYGISKSVLGKQIGNAVPVLLARMIGEEVVRVVNESG
jgi:DNA (cytosine-5)-methyltransferase 1